MTSTTKIVFIYWRLMGFDGEGEFVGGVETYIRQLADLCAEMGLQPILFQCGNRHFESRLGPLRIVGIKTRGTKNCKKNRELLFQAALKIFDTQRDILVFAAQQWSVKNTLNKTILIQHGIGFDLPIRFLSNKWVCHHIKLAANFKRWWLRSNLIRFYNNSAVRVCVDYNFPNWYRTFRDTGSEGDMWVIPNSTELLPRAEITKKLNQNRKEVNILFARRFETFRGTRLMAQTAKRILQSHDYVSFTFAGEGNDDGWLRNFFQEECRVRIEKVPYEDRMRLHYEHDIAVIPSFGSEGTSLSVAEAMCSGCAVIATASGGITNMIIDQYNGIMVLPLVEKLEESMTLLIKNPGLRRQIAGRGYEVACAAFSLEKWKKEWTRVILSVLNRKPDLG